METINMTKLVRGEQEDLTKDYDEHQRSFFDWALIEFYSQQSKKIQIERGDEGTSLAIECKINGVEVSLLKLLDRLHSQYDSMVQRKAEKITEEHSEKFRELLMETEEKLRSATALYMKSLDPELEKKLEDIW